jgi:hypothetical protein
MQNLYLRCRARGRVGVSSQSRSDLLSLTLKLLVFSVVCAVWAGNASAQIPRDPVLNPGNGHYYQLFSDVGFPLISFDFALTRAESTSHLGIPGHLVTITSPAEQQFLTSTYGGTSFKIWIGASDAAVEGEWRWVAGPERGQLFWQGDYVTGTAVGFHSWLQNNTTNEQFEPNNLWVPAEEENAFTPGEDFAAMEFWGGTWTRVSQWNDVVAFDTTFPGASFNPRYYIVEFSPIPEPSGLVIAAAGVLVLPFACRFRGSGSSWDGRGLRRDGVLPAS